MRRGAGEREWAWRALGLAPTTDMIEVRRAYARRLKAIDPDSDPQAFIALREARDFLFFMLENDARHAQAAHQDEPEVDDGVQDDAATLGNMGLTLDPPILDPLVLDPLVLDQAPAPTATPRAEAPLPDEGPPPPGDDGESPDPALFQRIETLLFDSPDMPDWAALEQATAALLADPSLDRIQLATSIESWLAGTIVNTMPRSDPMLDPVVAHFGWDASAREFRRAPIIDAIVQRRADRDFELSLAEEFPEYRRALALLRSPVEPRRGWRTWRESHAVRAFLSYARLHHPTSISCCDRAALQWWDGYCFKAPFFRDLASGFVRLWRGQDNPEGLYPPTERDVGLPLLAGIAVFPYIFGWLVLRRGHSMLARAATLAWTGIAVAGIFLAPPAPPARLAPGEQSLGADPAVSLNPILGRLSRGRLDLLSLQSSNPELYTRLVDAWSRGRDGTRPTYWLDTEVIALLDAAYRNAIRGTSPLLQADYWRLRENQLIWLRGHYGAGSCDRFNRHEYRYSIRFPDDLMERARRLKADILRDPGAPVDRAASITIAGPVIAQLGRRTGLSGDEVGEALAHHSTAANRCAVQIALIETALAAPPASSERLLRGMSSLE